MKVLFLRHGQTEVNIAMKVHRKDDDAGLDQIGEDQARKLAIVCFQEGVTKLYCSPEKRALHTAGIIASELGLEPILLGELGERDWGEWSGRPWAEIQGELERMDLKQRYEFIPPSGESWKAMDERLRLALEKITSIGDSVAVVTHGGALRALMPILKGGPKESSFQYDFKNASVTIFDYKGGKWTSLRENDTIHLLEET